MEEKEEKESKKKSKKKKVKKETLPKSWWHQKIDNFKPNRPPPVLPSHNKIHDTHTINSYQTRVGQDLENTPVSTSVLYFPVSITDMSAENCKIIKNRTAKK